MSTVWTEIDNPLEKTHPKINNKLEVLTGLSEFGSTVRIFIYRKDTEVGEKFTLTEETWRELITALEVAGNHIGWEQ